MRLGETSSLEASSNAGVCCDHQNIHSMCNDLYKSDEVNREQLLKAEKMGDCKLCSADEVKGEIIYFQLRLLCNAVAREHFTGLVLTFHLRKCCAFCRVKWIYSSNTCFCGNCPCR